MRKIQTKGAAILNARPEDVYAIIADYRQGHPSILPPKNLYDLQVEQGGYGAGTVIRFKSCILGVEQSYYQRASEPEPGRVLVEQDIDSVQQFTTTFTVLPLEQGQKSRVEIGTTMNASPGLRGFAEWLVLQFINPSIYREELKRLEVVARKKETELAALGQR